MAYSSYSNLVNMLRNLGTRSVENIYTKGLEAGDDDSLLGTLLDKGSSFNYQGETYKGSAPDFMKQGEGFSIYKLLFPEMFVNREDISARRQLMEDQKESQRRSSFHRAPPSERFPSIMQSIAKKGL